MYKLFLLLLVFHHIIPNSAVMQCCPEPNIVVNKTCIDGSNVAIFSCPNKHLVGPTMKNPETIEIDVNESLIISSQFESDVFKIEPNMFCITRNPENTSTLAYVCYTEDEKPTISENVVYYIKIFCAAITFIFSLITFIVYLFTEDLHDLEGKCVLHFTAGLCIEHLSLMCLPLIQSFSRNVCDVAAFVYYTSILFYFIWLSVISFHVWRLTVPIFRKQIKWFVIYCLYGYGVPLLVLVTAATYHHLQPKNVSTSLDYTCGTTLGSIGIWTYFYGPLFLIVIMCVLPLLWAAKRLWINIDRRETAQCVVRLRAKCRLFGHLTALMSSVLLIDAAMNAFHGRDKIMEYFWDALDCRNLIVGIAVFLILVVYRNKVLIALAKRGLCCIKFPDKWAKLVNDEREEKDNEEATLTPFTSI